MSKWGKGGNLYWRRDRFFASMTAYQARANNQFQIADEVHGIQVGSVTNNLIHKSVANTAHLHRMAQVPQIPDEVYGVRLISYPNQVVYKKVANSIFFRLNTPQITDEVYGIRISQMPERVLYRKVGIGAFSPRFNRLQFAAAEFPQINIHEIGQRLVKRVASSRAFVTASRFVVADITDEALPEGVILVPHVVYQTPRGAVQSYLVITRLASLEVIFPLTFSDTEDPIILTTQDANVDSLTTSKDDIVLRTEVP